MQSCRGSSWHWWGPLPHVASAGRSKGKENWVEELSYLLHCEQEAKYERKDQGQGILRRQISRSLSSLPDSIFTTSKHHIKLGIHSWIKFLMKPEPSQATLITTPPPPGIDFPILRTNFQKQTIWGILPTHIITTVM